MTASVEFPAEWKAGQEHVITVRSGEAEGDIARSLGIPVRIVEAERHVPAPAVATVDIVEAERHVPAPAVATVDTSVQHTDFAGYPKFS